MIQDGGRSRRSESAVAPFIPKRVRALFKLRVASPIEGSSDFSLARRLVYLLFLSAKIDGAEILAAQVVRCA